jgi:hypothetical protein
MISHYALAGLCLLAATGAAQAQNFMVGGLTTENNGFATSSSTSTSRMLFTDPLSAHDGCQNAPGIAHNSADCGVIVWMDPKTPIPTAPDHLLTGAERNVLRNASILWGFTRPHVPPGSTWSGQEALLIRPKE